MDSEEESEEVVASFFASSSAHFDNLSVYKGRMRSDARENQNAAESRDGDGGGGVDTAHSCGGALGAADGARDNW